jgi:DNA-binding XRE family transcriptional regulator
LISEPAALQLQQLGQHIRAHRKQLRVSASMAAQAAGLSRVTLHRIEQGAASVTMGAYLNVMAVLGLRVTLSSPSNDALPPRAASKTAATLVPEETIRLADYPQLQALAWQLEGQTTLSPDEALGLYERNWRHLPPDGWTVHEQALLDRLIRTVGKGQLLV